MSSFLNNLSKLKTLSSHSKFGALYYIEIYRFTSNAPVIKGQIAKRIPAYVELKKNKTYAWCSCGLSQKQPFCDGSHKNHPQKLEPVRFQPPKDGRFLLCRCKQTNNRPYCDLTHIKTFIPEGLRNALKIKL